MIIQLTASQVQKFELWKDTFSRPLPYLGATGGHFGLEIIFTSIGEVIKAKSWDGNELDLTDYENW